MKTEIRGWLASWLGWLAELAVHELRLHTKMKIVALFKVTIKNRVKKIESKTCEISIIDVYSLLLFNKYNLCDGKYEKIAIKQNR